MVPFLSIVLMFFVYALVTAIAAKLIKDIRRLRQEARVADEVAESSAALALGPAIVQGSVEFDDGAEYAVIMEICQRGSERFGTRSVTTHHWHEVERRCFAQPFWIRHVSGERVRVEPSKDVELVDRLEITVQDQVRERFRIAELSEGENVVAKGTLELSAPSQSKNYREAGPRTWILVQGERALHLSAERLGDSQRRLANGFMKNLVFGWLPCALLVSGISIWQGLTVPFFAWFFAFLIASCSGLALLPPKEEWHAAKKLIEGGSGKLPKPEASARTIYSRITKI